MNHTLQRVFGVFCLATMPAGYQVMDIPIPHSNYSLHSYREAAVYLGQQAARQTLTTRGLPPAQCFL